MKRRDFLSTMSAAAFFSPMVGGSQSASGATALYDGRAIALDRVSIDPKQPATLWVQKTDLPRINGFELKPQGMCREDVCIPVPATMSRGTTFNLSAFAQRAGQRAMVDVESKVWSFAEIPVVRGAYLQSRMAPDVPVPDRKGRAVRLSQFRGKKVLLVTWASW